jgi:hypothetical protein
MAIEDKIEETGQSADDRPEGNAPVPEPKLSPEPDKAQAKPEDRNGWIPPKAHDAEKARRRKAEQEAAQLRGYLTAFQEQLNKQPAQPQQPQQQQPLPNWYDDPEAAWKARVETAITPEMASIKRQLEEFQKRSADAPRQVLAETSRMVANGIHGEDTVKAAYEAMDTAMKADPRFDAEMKARLSASSDPYGEIVRWHKTNTEKPHDIEAEVERRLAERLAQMGGAPHMQPYAPQSPYPSNFANSRNAGGKNSSAWGGPKPLTEIFGGR